MAIIKQYHKDTDTTYVYESISYWDEEKKQSRSKRRVIGKLDPVTGEIVPTGKRGRRSKNPENRQEIPAASAADRQAEEKIRELTSALAESRARVTALEEENRKLRGILSRLEKHASQCAELCAPFAAESERR